MQGRGPQRGQMLVVEVVGMSKKAVKIRELLLISVWKLEKAQRKVRRRV